MRSRPGKMDLLRRGRSFTGSSWTCVALARGGCFEPQNDSCDYQQQGPKLQETVTRESAEQKDRARSDQHERAHQRANAAARASAIHFWIVGHGVLSYDVRLMRSIKIHTPSTISPAGQARANHSRSRR